MKKIISTILVLCMITATISVSAFTSNAEARYYCKDEFEVAFDCKGFHYTYDEYYHYFSETNSTDTPDWVFGKGFLFAEPSPCQGTFGDYCFYSGGLCVPYNLGFFVYVPSENKFYDVIQAWELGFENLEYAFAQCAKQNIYGIDVIGDADNNGDLSIMDATLIQLALVGSTNFSTGDDIRAHSIYGDSIIYISDFDKDGNRTILDATAIQLALLEA